MGHIYVHPMLRETSTEIYALHIVYRINNNIFIVFTKHSDHFLRPPHTNYNLNRIYEIRNDGNNLECAAAWNIYDMCIYDVIQSF